jgi:hypothetical protein
LISKNFFYRENRFKNMVDDRDRRVEGLRGDLWGVKEEILEMKGSIGRERKRG